jgi:glycerol-3-phosphate acyltransferase PlsX
MKDKITIAIDCMGGDNAPDSVIDGLSLVLSSVSDDVFFLLYGNSNKIEKCLLKNSNLQSKSKVIHTDEYVSADDKPHIAV